jgi:exopolysaccharide production protein ExoY
MSAPFLQLTERCVSRPSTSASLLLAWSERALAAATFVVASPLLFAVTASVRILSGRSPLVAHKRIGLDGEPFWMLKVRTMWGSPSPARSGSERSLGGWIEYLDQPWVPPEKQMSDPRVTSRFAVWYRRYSVDELPQLLHVLSGRMRLVGPRPMTREEIDQYYGEQAAGEVLSVKPGLTGLWQVKGRNRLTYRQRRRLDLFFVRKSSSALILRILARTPACVLNGRNAW